MLLPKMKEKKDCGPPTRVWRLPQHANLGHAQHHDTRLTQGMFFSLFFLLATMFFSSFLGFNLVHNVPMPSEAAVFLPIEAGSDDVWKLGGW
jgi:hypothetical protein